MGRPRTPTAVLERRGSRRGKDRAPNEPRPRGEAKIPEWLSPEAKQIWHEVIRTWTETPGLITAVDANALARYCETFAAWRRNHAYCLDHGDHYTLYDKDGNIRYYQLRPEATQRNKQAILLMRMEREFGMTPSSRARLRVPDSPQEESGKSQFFTEGLKVV